MLMFRRTIRLAFALALMLVLFMTAGRACAGTDAGLAFETWGPGQHLELNARTVFERSGPTDSGDLGINIYHEDFRLRPNPKDKHELAFGSDVTDINIQGSDPALGPRLVDQSYAVGFQAGRLANYWDLGWVAGFGYSGSTPYVDGRSYYAKGSLVMVHHYNKVDSLAVVVDYNGNRTFLPDWPIPTIVYQHIEGDRLSWVLGLPVAALHWKPTQRWTIDMSYTPWLSVNGSIQYEFIKHVRIFAEYDTGEWAFHRDGTDPSRRLFFQQSRAQAGVRWVPLPMLRIAAGAGYAFNQKFTRGWDLRSTDTVLKLHNEPFVELQATLYF